MQCLLLLNPLIGPAININEFIRTEENVSTQLSDYVLEIGNRDVQRADD